MFNIDRNKVQEYRLICSAVVFRLERYLWAGTERSILAPRHGVEIICYICYGSHDGVDLKLATKSFWSRARQVLPVGVQNAAGSSAALVDSGDLSGMQQHSDSTCRWSLPMACPGCSRTTKGLPSLTAVALTLSSLLANFLLCCCPRILLLASLFVVALRNLMWALNRERRFPVVFALGKLMMQTIASGRSGGSYYRELPDGNAFVSHAKYITIKAHSKRCTLCHSCNQ